MIDLHTHILPSFDDGAASIPQTVIEGRRGEKRHPLPEKELR
jgi:tyrosine-protein phosphatase YwqE